MGEKFEIQKRRCFNITMQWYLLKIPKFSIFISRQKETQTLTYKRDYHWRYTKNRNPTEEAPDDDFINLIHRRWKKQRFQKFSQKYSKNNHTYKNQNFKDSKKV